MPKFKCSEILLHNLVGEVGQIDPWKIEQAQTSFENLEYYKENL